MIFRCLWTITNRQFGDLENLVSSQVYSVFKGNNIINNNNNNSSSF